MFTVSSRFIGDFKLGDNINHHLRVLKILYRTQRDAESSEAACLCKPIIIFIASICEAIFYDLFCIRIETHTVEKVKGICNGVMNDIRGKKVDKLEHFIAAVKKHDLLKDAGIYDSLDDLRKLRNRIHIQNTKGHFDPDDGKAFTMTRQRELEKTLEKLAKVMAKDYARKPSCQGHVDDFQLPWEEYDPSPAPSTAGVVQQKYPCKTH